MAGQNADEVVVAQNGKILLAPLGSTAPTDTSTAWDVAWIDLGYATEDGVSLGKSVTTQDVFAWQSLTALRRLISTGEFTIGFTAMQTNSDVLENWFGATYSSGIYTLPKDPVQPEKAIGVEWVDGTDVYRMVIYKAALSDFGDVALNRQGAIGYQMTWAALPDATESNLAIVIDPTAV